MKFRKTHSAGDSIRYEIDYSQWLPDGVTLSTESGDCTAVTDAITATVTNVVVLPDRLTFFVTGGEVNSPFTVSIQITTTRNEVKLDEIDFIVV